MSAVMPKSITAQRFALSLLLVTVLVSYGYAAGCDQCFRRAALVEFVNVHAPQHEDQLKEWNACMRQQLGPVNILDPDYPPLKQAFEHCAPLDVGMTDFVIAGTPQIGTQGTTQLAGDWGEFGKAYTLDKDDPIVFTLRDVAVASQQTVAMCDDEFTPEEGNIFLMVKYTLHNPQHDDYPVTGNGSFIVFTLVDADGKNYTHCNYAALEKDNSNLDGVRLKPAQKVDVFTLIEVPKNAKIHKLIVEPYESEPVVRYDLREKLKAQ